MTDGVAPLHPPLRHHLPRAWVAVLVLVALIATLAVLKVVGTPSGGPRTTTALAVAPAMLLREVTDVPASVFDEVGVRSALVPIVAPRLVPVATTDPLAEHGRPVVLYVGTEYCSFCASERWPLIVALSRFGTFHSLDEMQSSPVDFAPNTPTFTFFETSYTSPYLVFRPFEVESDVLGATGYEPLMALPRSLGTAVTGIVARTGYPVVDVAGRAIASEASFSPMTFAGLTRDEVAGDLVDPADPVTAAIISSANYLTAAICGTDGQRPSAVCTSSGVRAADAALGVAP